MSLSKQLQLLLYNYTQPFIWNDSLSVSSGQQHLKKIDFFFAFIILSYAALNFILES